MGVASLLSLACRETPRTHRASLSSSFVQVKMWKGHAYHFATETGSVLYYSETCRKITPMGG